MSGSEYRESPVEVSGKGSRGIRRGEKEEGWAHNIWGRSMEEPGDQCTVVFALTVTGPATGGGDPPPSSQFRNNLCKDDSALFSDSSVDRSIV